MGNAQTKPILSKFQREKLLHEFRTFYDLDGNGVVTEEDFNLAKKRVQKLNRWEADSAKMIACDELYNDIWQSLCGLADSDKDGQVTDDEWLSMWEKFLQKNSETAPFCIDRYMIHRFHILDRAGDGKIDQDEFEYVMSEFNVPISEARKAWLLVSEHNTKEINLNVFLNLANEYFFSNDPASLGNFIMGKLHWETIDGK